MIKYKIKLEYEGTRYSGWQIQKNSKSIQGILIDAVKKITNSDKVELIGSGRTDKGVHALEQVAHLSLDKYFNPTNLKYAINDLLPYDINILSIEQTDIKFHARHDAIARSYIYQISNFRSAFLKPYIWWIKDNLDLKKMQEAANCLVGLHDFKNFSKIDDKNISTNVMVYSSELKEIDNIIVFRIKASHFLWNMVRRIVGNLVEIGRGNISIQSFQNYLRNIEKPNDTYTAPPSGLFLERIYYSKNEKESNLKPAINRNLWIS
jgi:tRNA pseudouridine38-40 synthase